jgi:1-acyl-sn-glycerol-3-phosphate acyltransferase
VQIVYNLRKDKRTFKKFHLPSPQAEGLRMRRMKQFRGHSWYYYFICVFAISFIVLYPLQWLLLQKPSWYPAAHRYRSLWARLILATWFVRYHVQNKQYFPDKPGIICSNHSSYLDILVLLAIFPKRTCFMAKAELSDIPLFGLFFKTIDIEVDRQSGEGGARAYRKAVKALNNNYNVVIFPEGGIHPDPQRIKPFKDGAFQLAIRQRADIITVGLPDNYKILPDEAKIAKPGKIRIILHKPLKTLDITIQEIEGLKQSLFEILQKDLIL